MKKQTTGRKSWIWILLAVVAVVIVAAGVLAAVLLGGSGEQEPEAEPKAASKLYWNVDRAEYVAKGESGTTGRMKRADGYYYIRFAVEGEQVDIPVADVSLVEWIDMYELVGLVLDDQGVCVDVLDIYEFTGGLAANNYYVESIDGTTYVCNTNSTYKGTTATIQIPEDANVYNVGEVGLLMGMRSDIEPDDRIIAVKNTQGIVTDVFVTPYKIPGDIYWNITRMYDNTTKTSTRERGVTGYFEYEMCYGGELVTIRTREQEVANSIDSFVAHCMGLEFDEDGFVTATIRANDVCGGSAVGSWYHVTKIEGDTVTMEKISGGSDQGNVVSMDIGRHCKTVLTATGEYTEVKEGDQVHCLSDSRSRLAYIFIINRPSETAKVCWNVDRQRDPVTQKSLRKPDKDGYYHVMLAVDGELKEYRTNSKEIIDQVDGYGAYCFAAEFDGDIILTTFSAYKKVGGTVVMSWFTVDDITDGVVTATKRGDESHKDYMKTESIKLAEDYVAYNVSDSAMTKGEITEVMEDDMIHCFTNFRGELALVYIVKRPIDAPVYYNLERQWDSTKEVTTREKAADGYYYFQMAVNGKQVTLKTKDREVANAVDSNPAKCVTLRVQGDVILKSYSATFARKCSGGVAASYYNITSIKGNTVVVERQQEGKEFGNVVTLKLTSNCEIYDVSTAFQKFKGEATKLQMGDLVHCLMNPDQQTTLIYVVSRKLQGKIGWNVNRQWDSVNLTTKRVPDAEGWYYIDLAIDGKVQTLKTQDLAVINEIDSAGAKCRGLILEGDVIKRALSPSMIWGTDGGINGSWVNVTELTKDGCIAKKLNGEEAGTVYDIKMAADCKVYNVSGIYKNNAGEETKLKMGALIHVLVNAKKEATIIYVIQDGIEGGKEGHCNVCNKTVTWAPWDGASTLVTDIHYYLDQDVHMKTYVTLASSNSTLFLNGHTITSDSRAFKLTGTTNLKIFDSMKDGKSIGGKIITKGMTAQETEEEGNGGANEGGVIMMWSGTCQVSLYGGTLQLAQENNGVKNGGVINGAGVFNMYGGSVIGGPVGLWGGAVRLYRATGQFNLYDGVVTGGTARDGGSVSMNSGATMNMYGGVVTGGVSGDDAGSRYGGNIFIEQSTLNLFGGTVTGGTSHQGGNIAITSESVLNMTGGTVKDGKAYRSEDIGNGGNIFVSGNCSASLAGGSVTGGEACRGGNIAAYGSVAVSGVTLDAGAASKNGACIIVGSNGTLELHNVTVPQAEGATEAIHYGGTSLTLSGKLNIGQIALGKNSLTIGKAGLDNSSVIAIADSDPATAFVTIPEAADQACFVNAKEYYVVQKDDQNQLFMIYQAPAHIHCDCGGLGNLGDHSCGEGVEWTAISSAEQLLSMLVQSTGDEDGKGNESFLRFADEYDEGYYYLTEDIVMDEVIEIHQADNIHLCLNGKTLTHSSKTGNSPWRVWGKLSISDCGESGKILSQYKNGPVIFMIDNNASQDGIVLNLYGGTIEAADTNYTSTGVLRMGNNGSVPCVVNMYGGTIAGGTGEGGGNVTLVRPGSVLNMYGGAITGGKTLGTNRNTKSGGNIFISSGVLRMYGGTVSGGSCDTTVDETSGEYGMGHDIYIGGSAKEVLIDCAVGDMDIATYGNKGITLGEHFVGTGTITVDCFTTSTNIVAGGATAENTTCFVPANAQADQLKQFSDKLLIGPVDSRFGCVCGGALENDENHECELLAWTPLTKEIFDSWTAHANDGGSRISVTGNYYLTEDLQIDRGIRGINSFNLDLNGYTLTRTDAMAEGSSGTRIAIRIAAPISICDSSYDPEAKEYTERFQGRIQCDGGRTLNATNQVSVYGGNIGDGQNAMMNIFVDGAAARLDLYDGVIVGNTYDSANGGNITVNNGATFNMYGGVVTGGSAKRGGNVTVITTGSSFNMYGGLITGGKATSTTNGHGGGNIYSEGAVTITGGEISGGEAKVNNGGNIYLTGASGKLTFTGGIVKDGVAMRGGNIQFNATGTAEGRPIHEIGGEAIVSGGRAEGGSAGSLYINSAKLLISGNAQITGGWTQYSGGNMRVNGVLTVTGGTISGGVAETGSGGNIYLESAAVVSLADCTVTGGNAKVSGSGIYSDGADVTVSGDVKIIDNVGTDLYLNSKSDTEKAQVIVGQLGENARIGVAMKTAGVFAENVTTDLSGLFVSNDETYQISWTDNTLTLIPKN